MTKFNQNFWKWFGASKVADEKGNPLVVYHGTTAPEKFEEFLIGEKVYDEDAESMRRGSGADPSSFIGAHFTNRKSVADSFAKGLYGERHRSGERGRVYQVYLSIQNPLVTNEARIQNWINVQSYSARVIELAIENLVTDPYSDKQYRMSVDEGYKKYDEDPVFRWEINKAALSDESEFDENFELAQEMGRKYRKMLQKKGYDGVVYENFYEGGMGYIIFEPWQAKSVFNSGVWSRETGNIMNPPKLRPGWKRGPCGPYGDMGYVRGRYGVARKYTASCTPSKTTWNVYYNGRGIDSWDLPLVEVLRIVEEQIQSDERR